MAMSALEKEFFRYFIHLSEVQKRTMLEMMKAFLKNKNRSGNRTTIEQYNQEIDEAMERIDHGEFTSLEDLEKEMEEW